MFFYNSRFFFGIPNTESRSRGFGIGIFYFWLDRKIPKILKSRGSGSGLENLESKIPILGLTVFWPSGFFRDFLKIPRIRDYFKSWNFYPLDSKFFISVEIFIPGIRDFNPGDSGFFLISGFYPQDLCEIRDFLSSWYPGNFLSPGSGFFSWYGISRQKATSDFR